MPDSCVVPQIEILTYFRVRSVFDLQDALLSTMIWHFETTSSNSCFANSHFKTAKALQKPQTGEKAVLKRLLISHRRINLAKNIFIGEVL
jgi:hypothetical protein